MDIAAWLQELGLAWYEEAFRGNDIDAEVLADLTEADLEKLGVSLGHRKKLLKAIAELKAPSAGVAAAPSPSSRPAVAGEETRTAEAERRQLTVMFVDLVGSTALAARLDPEDMGRVIRAYQQSCAEVVERWGGHVAKYMGDGVLAYFGWPVAHEDEAERAIKAGLELAGGVVQLDTPAGEPLAARIGIATGLVMVGELIGEGAAKEQTVVGETPNLAARLQALAAPGSVVIAPVTRRLVASLFELVDLGEHDLKGFGERIRVWQVVGKSRVESRFEAQRGPHSTPLVSRERELDVLEDACEEARAGRGQIVAAVGEPGVGKSRLFDAFLRSDTLAGWTSIGPIARRPPCLMA